MSNPFSGDAVLRAIHEDARKPPLTDTQKRLLAKRDRDRRNRHDFESSDPRRPEKCDICGFDRHHPYHGN